MPHIGWKLPSQRLLNDDFEIFCGEKSDIIWNIEAEQLNYKKGPMISPIFPQNCYAKFKWDITLYPNCNTKGRIFYLQENFSRDAPVIVSFQFSIKSELKWEVKKGVLYFNEPNISHLEFYKIEEFPFIKTDGDISIQMRVTACYDGNSNGESHLTFAQNLLRNYNSILSNGSFSDLILCAKDDGAEFKVHRTVLGARSSVFAAMLSCDMKENKEGRIEIPDISSLTVKKLLDFMYVCDIEFESVSETINLMEAADKYNLMDLKSECARYLATKINADNAVDILEEAHLLNATRLKEDVLNYMHQNKGKFCNPVIFEKCNSKLLAEIIVKFAEKH